MSDKDNPWFDQEPDAEEREWDERYYKMNEDAAEEISELRGKYLGETIDIETYLTEIVAAYLVNRDKELYERLMENIFWHRSISFFTKIDFAENLSKQDEGFWISRDTIKLLRQTGERRNVLAHQTFSVDYLNLDEGPLIKPTTAKGLRGDKGILVDQELSRRWIPEAQRLKNTLGKITGGIELAWFDEQYPEVMEAIEAEIEEEKNSAIQDPLESLKETLKSLYGVDLDEEVAKRKKSQDSWESVDEIIENVKQRFTKAHDEEEGKEKKSNEEST